MASPEVQALRARLEHQAGAVERGSPITVSAVVSAFMVDAASRYTKRPGLNSELRNVQASAAPLLLLFGDDLAESFGPSGLRVLQLYWIERGLALTTINGHAGRVRRIFAWAASRELVSARTAGSLKLLSSVDPREAPSPPEVEAVPIEHAKALLAWLESDAAPGHAPSAERDGDSSTLERDAHGAGRGSPSCEGPGTGFMSRSRATLAAMIRVQLWTSCRPGEVCSMRGDQLDVRGRPWIYRPKHKGTWRRRPRLIPIGKRARAVLLPFLELRGPGVVFTTKRGTAFNTTSYGHEVTRQCIAAGVPHWSPNQLRHLAGTLANARRGPVSQVLGHSDARTSRRYVHDDVEQASEYAETWG